MSVTLTSPAIFYSAFRDFLTIGPLKLMVHRIFLGKGHFPSNLFLLFRLFTKATNGSRSVFPAQLVSFMVKWAIHGHRLRLFFVPLNRFPTSNGPTISTRNVQGFLRDTRGII